MTVVNSRVFAENPIHYLNLSNNEEIVIKRGKKIYHILPKPAKKSNPVDPDDPYWDDPRNIEEYEKIIKLRDEGKLELTELTPEMQKELLGV